MGNALCWSADDAAHYPGSPTERIAAAFHADVELVNGFDGTADFVGTDEQRAGIGESKRNYAVNDEVELIGLRVLKTATSSAASLMAL